MGDNWLGGSIAENDLGVLVDHTQHDAFVQKSKFNFTLNQQEY